MGSTARLQLRCEDVREPALPTRSTDVKGSNRPTLRNEGHIIRIPTLHVHGTRDNGLKPHRELFEEFCVIERRELIEWDGDHRVPLKFKDVSLTAGQIRELAEQTRIYQKLHR